MKIAYCLPQLQAADTAEASFLQQIQIANALKARGHHVDLVASHGLQETICTVDPEVANVAPRTWSATGWFDLAAKGAWRTQRLLGVPYLNIFSNLRSLDACLQCLPGHDVVQERNGLYRAGVAMACKRLELPYVLFFDGDDLLEHDIVGDRISGLLRWRAGQMFRYNLYAADCVICVSNTMRARLIDVWNVQPQKIAVFPNGVDTDRYRPDPGVRAETRASLGVGGEPLIIFVGGFFPWQDLSLLLEAFAQVLTDCPSARLLMVGDGQTRVRVWQQASDLGITGSVQFTGAVPHYRIPQLLDAADVAVAPYGKVKPELFWNSPMKLYEYMASGTALIASDQQQITEVIQDGQNGLVVAAGDKQALKSALIKLIADPALRSRLGQRARQDAIDKHSWQQYAARLEGLYDAVIARQPLSFLAVAA